MCVSTTNKCNLMRRTDSSESTSLSPWLPPSIYLCVIVGRAAASSTMVKQVTRMWEPTHARVGRADVAPCARTSQIAHKVLVEVRASFSALHLALVRNHSVHAIHCKLGALLTKHALTLPLDAQA